MKRIKVVRVLPGCIGCGTCAVVCPKVFHINSISQVIEGVDPNEHKNCIEEAAEMCPVDAIEFEWEERKGEC